MTRFVFALPFALLTIASATAAEGMWTPDNLPHLKMQETWHFSPDQSWIDHAQRAAVRLTGSAGCSGSFVSGSGLVLTNHHCVNSCVQQLSTADRDFIKSGFYAKEEKDEVKCPETEIDRLDAISNVTDQVKAATADKAGEAYIHAEKAVKSDIEKECVGSDAANTRCDVIDLYHGGVYDLYKYHRFQDVRLVFAPEFAMAFFGGDPDNFNFPRYDLDMGMLRAYENGAPAKVADYFPFSKAGADEGEMTVVIGNPGGTDRQLTISELESTRDIDLPHRLMLLAEQRGVYERFRAENPEHERIAESDLFSVENSFKALKGQLEALQDPKVFAFKSSQEAELRKYVNSDAALRQKYGGAWDAIDKALVKYRDLERPFLFVERAQGF
ncbi:MAG TPA: S46 family peptidase, partial [Xanthomonadaceae bacterium]|nr:S46 family peptidase [Xanthomonadaceae bacterium]